jgi:uncharacterized repeat protein (TIGR03803 family)
MPDPITLHVLNSATDGWAVRGSLVELGGRLYGLAGECGPNGADGCASTARWQTAVHTRQCPGTLFSLCLDGSGFSVDHAFSQLNVSGLNEDGYHPYGSLALGPDGRLYGVTQMGGTPQGLAGSVGPGMGVLFRYDPATHLFETLHHFFDHPRAFDGQYPMGTVAIDRRGLIYGTCKGGGAHGTGTVWRWAENAPFVYAPLPGEGYGGPCLDAHQRRLHLANWTGGASNTGQWLVVDADTLAVTPIFDFPAFQRPDHGDDNTPIQEPTLLSDGSIIMPRELGGTTGFGVVYRLVDKPDAAPVPIWSAAAISLDATPRFSNPDGSLPNGRVVEGLDGMLYGCVQYGGASGTGGIWRMARNGTQRELIHSFPDAAYPYGGPTFGSDGALYVVTFGTGRVIRFEV